MLCTLFSRITFRCLDVWLRIINHNERCKSSLFLRLIGIDDRVLSRTSACDVCRRRSLYTLYQQKITTWRANKQSRQRLRSAVPPRPVNNNVIIVLSLHASLPSERGQAALGLRSGKQPFKPQPDNRTTFQCSHPLGDKEEAPLLPANAANPDAARRRRASGIPALHSAQAPSARGKTRDSWRV